MPTGRHGAHSLYNVRLLVMKSRWKRSAQGVYLFARRNTSINTCDGLELEMAFHPIVFHALAKFLDAVAGISYSDPNHKGAPGLYLHLEIVPAIATVSDSILKSRMQDILNTFYIFQIPGFIRLNF